MINQKVFGTLAHYSYTYKQLTEFWEKAKEGIKAPLPSQQQDTFVLEGYDVDQAEHEDGSAIHFQLFGARCYVAFTHDLESGKLEYGVIDPKDTEQRRRIQCSALEFDVSANLGEVGKPGPWSVFDPKSVQSAHLTWIAKIAPQLVSAYYDAYHVGAASE